MTEIAVQQHSQQTGRARQYSHPNGWMQQISCNLGTSVADPLHPGGGKTAIAVVDIFKSNKCNQQMRNALPLNEDFEKRCGMRITMQTWTMSDRFPSIQYTSGAIGYTKLSPKGSQRYIMNPFLARIQPSVVPWDQPKHFSTIHKRQQLVGCVLSGDISICLPYWKGAGSSSGAMQRDPCWEADHRKVKLLVSIRSKGSFSRHLKASTPLVTKGRQTAPRSPVPIGGSCAHCALRPWRQEGLAAWTITAGHHRELFQPKSCFTIVGSTSLGTNNHQTSWLIVKHQAWESNQPLISSSTSMINHELTQYHPLLIHH